jgi:hypothetical protein
MTRIQPEPRCPLSGTYTYTVDRAVNPAADYTFIPPFMKNFNGTLAILTTKVFTRRNGRRMEIGKAVDIVRVTIRM